MLRSLQTWIGYEVRIDGLAQGRIVDFQFSGFDWFVVNLVVDPPTVTDRPLLISVVAADQPDPAHRTVRVDATKMQADKTPRASDSLSEREARDTELSSFQEVLTYVVSASDGPIGRVADLVIEADVWKIADMVVETDGAAPTRRRVLVPRLAIRDFVERERRVNVALTRGDVEKCPPID